MTTVTPAILSRMKLNSIGIGLLSPVISPALNVEDASAPAPTSLAERFQADLRNQRAYLARAYPHAHLLTHPSTQSGPTSLGAHIAVGSGVRAKDPQDPATLQMMSDLERILNLPSDQERIDLITNLFSKVVHDQLELQTPEILGGLANLMNELAGRVSEPVRQVIATNIARLMFSAGMLTTIINQDKFNIFFRYYYNTDLLLDIYKAVRKNYFPDSESQVKPYFEVVKFLRSREIDKIDDNDNNFILSQMKKEAAALQKRISAAEKRSDARMYNRHTMVNIDDLVFLNLTLLTGIYKTASIQDLEFMVSLCEHYRTRDVARALVDSIDRHLIGKEALTRQEVKVLLEIFNISQEGLSNPLERQIFREHLIGTFLSLLEKAPGCEQIIAEAIVKLLLYPEDITLTTNPSRVRILTLLIKAPQEAKFRIDRDAIVKQLALTKAQAKDPQVVAAVDDLFEKMIARENVSEQILYRLMYFAVGLNARWWSK